MKRKLSNNGVPTQIHSKSRKLGNNRGYNLSTEEIEEHLNFCTDKLALLESFIIDFTAPLIEIRRQINTYSGHHDVILLKLEKLIISKSLSSSTYAPLASSIADRLSNLKQQIMNIDIIFRNIEVHMTEYTLWLDCFAAQITQLDRLKGNRARRIQRASNMLLEVDSRKREYNMAMNRLDTCIKKLFDTTNGNSLPLEKRLAGMPSVLWNLAFEIKTKLQSLGTESNINKV